MRPEAGDDRVKTTHDDVLKHEWYCEHCKTMYAGVNPPNDCDVCGHVLFENGLDIAASGAPLPLPKRDATILGK